MWTSVRSASMGIARSTDSMVSPPLAAEIRALPSNELTTSLVVTPAPSLKVRALRSATWNLPPCRAAILQARTGTSSPAASNLASGSKPQGCAITANESVSPLSGVSLPSGPHIATRSKNGWRAGGEPHAKRTLIRTSRRTLRSFSGLPTPQSISELNPERSSPRNVAHHDAAARRHGTDVLPLRALDLHVFSWVRLLPSTRVREIPRGSGGRRSRGSLLRTSPACRPPDRGDRS